MTARYCRAVGEQVPEQTDNSARPEDGPQDVPQDPAVEVVGEADDGYDPDRDGVDP